MTGDGTGTGTGTMSQPDGYYRHAATTSRPGPGRGEAGGSIGVRHGIAAARPGTGESGGTAWTTAGGTAGTEAGSAGAAARRAGPLPRRRPAPDVPAAACEGRRPPRQAAEVATSGHSSRPSKPMMVRTPASTG
jgi:hypothetical protein